MTRRDALEILGLEADASLDEAKRAYHNLARHYHPDKNPAPNATAMFRYIHDAWEYIQNDAKTKQQAEAAQRQAEAKRRAAAARARQQAEAKRRVAAEKARQQAEAKRKAEAEKARQQAETKNSNPDEHDADETKSTDSNQGGWYSCGLLTLGIILFLVIASIAKSCRTDDKPIESSRTYIDSGKAKADKGQHFEAISDYDMAISLNPDSARAYYYRGLAKEKMDRGRGREDLQKALKFAEKAKEWDLHRTIKQKIKLLNFLESLPPLPDD